MKTHLIPALLAALCVTAIESRAQFEIGASFEAVDVTQSGVRDASGMWRTETQYRFTLDNTGGSAFFLNNITFNPTVNWHPDIDLGFETTDGFRRSFGSFYTYGTLINDGDSFTSEGFLRRFGAVASTVPVGLYEFEVDFLGGLDDASFDVLASIRYELEVVQSIDLSVGGTAMPGTISTGESMTVRMSVENNMTGREFLVAGLFFVIGGMEMEADDLNFGTFGGDWYSQPIIAGGSRTDDHTTWTAGAEDAPGTYTGTAMGVIGGLYNGEKHEWIMNSPQPSVVLNAVPEPSSWALLCAGAGLLGARALRAKRPRAR